MLLPQGCRRRARARARQLRHHLPSWPRLHGPLAPRLHEEGGHGGGCPAQPVRRGTLQGEGFFDFFEKEEIKKKEISKSLLTHFVSSVLLLFFSLLPPSLRLPARLLSSARTPRPRTSTSSRPRSSPSLPSTVTSGSTRSSSPSSTPASPSASVRYAMLYFLVSHVVVWCVVSVVSVVSGVEISY